MAEYKITKKQKEYLESLICQRVSDDDANRAIAKSFVNKRNSGIAAALDKGWNADKQDRVAYYLIKDPADNQPLLFFSLQCGEVHTPLVRESLKKSVENNMALLDAACGKDAPDWAKEVVEKRKVDGSLPYEKFVEMYDDYRKSQAKLLSFDVDEKLEGKNIIRTKKNFAGVELVHFCIHEPAREKWEAMGMAQQGMGKTLFWQFVVPIIQQIRQLVGCEYIYLFAADAKGNRDGKLVNYYKSLGFDFRDDLYVNKPSYDFCCFFMCQDVKTLRNKQRDFFGSYNKPKEPAAV